MEWLGLSDSVSTHSRLKAAGKSVGQVKAEDAVSTHSRLKAAGLDSGRSAIVGTFQHTAA